MQIFIVPFLVPVILDLLILVLGWISGFVVYYLLVVIYKSSVDRCLFRWEIKWCCVQPTFFIPVNEDEYQDETYGISSVGRDFFQMVIIKKVLILSVNQASTILVFP